MTGSRKVSLGLAWAILICLALQPVPAWACSACYGGLNDSSMAKGMNAGIFSLLGVVVVVLGSIGGFFFYLIKKSTASAQVAGKAEAADRPAWGQPSPFSASGAEKAANLNPTSA
jgi:hypothetical protein